MKTTTNRKAELDEIKANQEVLFEMVQKALDKGSQPIEPKKSVLAKHFDNIVENAITNPASTLSGVGVGVAYVGKMFFPAHAETFENIEVVCMSMVGVSAGSTALKGATAVKNTKPTPPKNEEYG